MTEADRTTLVCHRCGKEFVLELPAFCLRCNPGKHSRTTNLISAGPGTGLNDEALVYCVNCIAIAGTDSQQRINDYQNRTDELQSKLLIVGSQKARFETLLNQEEELIAVLEQKVSDLTRELAEAHKHPADLGTKTSRASGTERTK